MRRNFGLPSRTSHDFLSAYNGLHILGCRIVWPFFRNMSVDRMTFFPLLECTSFFLCFQICTLTNMGWFRVWLHLICFLQNFRSKNTAEVPWAKLRIQAFTVSFFPVFVKFSIWMCELVVYSAVRCSFLEGGKIAFQMMALPHTLSTWVFSLICFWFPVLF